MIRNHSEDRKLKQEDKRPFRKEIDGMSKYMQNAPLQRMKDPVWENKGDTEGVVMEEERTDAENSENDEETLTTGDALCYSTETIVDGMLKDGNQKVLQETIDEMAMTETTVGDQKFEDDKEKCCRLSENVVSPGDVEGVPIQEKREKDEKMLMMFTSTIIMRVVSALMMVMGLSGLVGRQWTGQKIMEKMTREML